MTETTVNRLCRAALACLAAGGLFLLIGDRNAAMAACAIGTAAGIVAAYGDPTIRPWQ